MEGLYFFLTVAFYKIYCKTLKSFMILSDRDILKRLEKDDLVIEPLDINCIQPSTVDFHLDRQISVFSNWRVGIIDLAKRLNVAEIVDIGRSGSFIIHPSEFILGSTIEKVKIPSDIAAKVEGKSSLGRLGLMIHATAGYIDPGFRGNITLEISNISRIPIKLYAGMRVCQVAFILMTSSPINLYGSKKLGSKYQGQKGPTASKVWKEFKK